MKKLFLTISLLTIPCLNGYITTIDCDNGSATGPELTLTASLDNAGSTLNFFGIESFIDLHASDGNANTIIGASAGNDSITGSDNIGLGQGSLLSLTTGSENTALGRSALFSITSGSENVAIGINAGTNYTTESQNICINAQGFVGDEQVLRVEGVNSAFIAGIAEEAISDGLPVMIASDGSDQLGIDDSSLALFASVASLDDQSSALMKLRPVSCTLKNSKSPRIHFKLITEEVAVAFPDLLAYGADEKFHVKYHELPTILLNEIQNQARTIQKQNTLIASLLKRVEALEKK